MKRLAAIFLVLSCLSTLGGVVSVNFHGHNGVVVGSLGAVEQRCTDLGANCLCSETLNDNFSLPVGAEESADFALSPDASECDVFGMENTASPGDFSGVAPPVALPGATYVMEQKAGPYGWLQAKLPPAGAKRMCIRYYFLVTNDWSGIGESSCPINRNKIAQIKLTPLLAQIQERSDTGACSGPGYGAYREFWLDTQLSGTILSPSTRFSDCSVASGNWCMVEECIGTSTDLYASGSKTIEAWVGPIGGTPGYVSVTENHAALDGPETGGDLYHSGPLYSPVGRRYVSAFMAAYWDTNAGQRIGPASEIEP